MTTRVCVCPAWPHAAGQGCQAVSLPGSISLIVPSEVSHASGSGGGCPVLAVLGERLTVRLPALLLAAFGVVL